MCASIIQAIARIKRNVAQSLTAASIVQACRDVQYTWRERELGPAQTVWAFLLQVLHGSEKGVRTNYGRCRKLSCPFFPSVCDFRC